jgi:thymidine kinase
MENNQSAYLEIILGSMFSGKTSRLVEIYKKCIYCNISVSVINSALDDRYEREQLTTHDDIKIPCIQTQHLGEVWNKNFIGVDINNCFVFHNDTLVMHKVTNSDVILINEGQFFPDLVKVVEEMLLHKKKIYVCGLDGDFERKKFGQILDLIPLCDKVTKLTSLCSICKNGTPGIFSKRITEEKQQTVIGVHNYVPVCRDCYEK